ncbi:MAG TPA: NADP-dependent methylenetetrahydromethanopterin/methylenetetrahydrofolate dehydrogenase [Xanthobacteraceae bacterium]|nr:NADP-dependent methylenetetrahydromethanopterin/methylenetetrahydrofolate dehydrogenase [Xanthobacteraceae bacterium]
MKRLLFLLDTDPVPSVFDTVVGYDGGADHVIGYGGVTPSNVGSLIDGTIFTRGTNEKRHTAIFVGGGSMAAGEELLSAVTKRFYANFRVSVMLDSNGSNTTAAAGVAQLAKTRNLAGKKAVVLAGTGPVGMRAAALLAKEGAVVSLTSRMKQRADAACRAVESRFGAAPTPIEAIDNDARHRAVKGAHIVFAAGAAGVELLAANQWQSEAEIELIADCNAQPPLGVAGVEATDKAKDRGGKLTFGALGIGALKLKLHRTCIVRLFERSDQVLDAEQIYALAKAMA